jgi:hypothetical protein
LSFLALLSPEECGQVTRFFNGQTNDAYFEDETNRRWGLKKENSSFSKKEWVAFDSHTVFSSEKLRSF